VGSDVLEFRDERGPLLGAAVLLLTVAVLLIDVRFEDDWSAGAHLLITALPAALALALALRARQEPRDVDATGAPSEDPDPGAAVPGEHPFGAPGAAPSGGAAIFSAPPAWLSVTLVCAFVLTLFALGNLADTLGADEDFSAGTLTWVGLLLTALAAWLALSRNSAICTLLAGASAVVTVLAFVDFAFDLDDPLPTFRWLLMLCSLALAAGAFVLRDRTRRHAVALVDVAGLAVLGLAFTFAISAFNGIFAGGETTTGAGLGWELFLLLAGVALVAYAALDREPGPGYLGAFALLAFVVLAATPDEGDGPSLVGWPLVLLVLAIAGLAFALRPRARA
jgi:hypothetical protein